MERNKQPDPLNTSLLAATQTAVGCGLGLLLGWFGPLKAMVRKKAAKSLRDYMEKHEGAFPVPG